AKWYYYVVLGLVDVEANYLVVKAYQYTSITSVMLLDCWSIPSVMLLTFIFLKTKYRFRKIAGVIVCVAGLVMVIFSDVHAGDRSELPMWVEGGRDPRKGDLLVIAGATLYAISNVSEAFPFFGFSLAMFLFYSFVPVLLKMSGSTMLNLSLLTSDMWAVIIRIFAYHEKDQFSENGYCFQVDWMYFLAFAAVAVGLVIYSGGDKEEDQHQCIAGVGDEDAGRSKYFDEEADFDNINRGAMAGSSKTGDTSKHDCITSGERSETIENKNIGKDVQGKKS
ncbi:hypothetical protein Gotri_004117, partial [Gossypium trilobum]|nr:hypothetical protein [Gossypium trilobum]